MELSKSGDRPTKRGPGHPPGPNAKPTIPGFIDETEQATRLGVSITTLRRWGYAGTGPTRVYIGYRPMYQEGADQRWMAEKVAAAERQARPVRRRAG